MRPGARRVRLRPEERPGPISWPGYQAVRLNVAGFGGILFSTFYGGHDTSWGPTSTQQAYFADFTLSPAVQH
ncbi:polysaccharide lyase [Kitasatospora sp. NPDC001660]